LQQEAGSNEEEEELVNKEAEERKKEKSLVTWQQQTNATAEDWRKNTKKSAKLTTTELCAQRQTRERKRREREREFCRVLVCRNLQRQITYIPLQPQTSYYAAFNVILESMCDSSMQNNLLPTLPKFFFFFFLGGGGGAGWVTVLPVSSLLICKDTKGLGWGICQN
jgi:hypothetical protein